MGPNRRLFLLTALSERNRTTVMRSIHQLVPVCFLAGCISTQPPQAGTLPPSPSAPVTLPSPPGSWTFRFAAGAIAYRISRSAVIENLSDSGRRELSTNSAYESLALQPAGDTIAFTAAVDTFTIAAQGAIGAVQSVQLPIQVAGSLIGDSLTIVADSITEKCSAVTTALLTDLHNLLLPWPATLSTTVSWRDSTDLTGCQGSIPTSSHSTRAFRVIGESTYEAIPVLVVQRADTIRAEGEGAQQQHGLQLKATGEGSATYYMDTSSGRILHISVSQDLSLTITTSGKTSYFRQSAKEEFTLVR
jgi:hypothetical protein